MVTGNSIWLPRNSTGGVGDLHDEVLIQLDENVVDEVDLDGLNRAARRPGRKEHGPRRGDVVLPRDGAVVIGLVVHRARRFADFTVRSRHDNVDLGHGLSLADRKKPIHELEGDLLRRDRFNLDASREFRRVPIGVKPREPSNTTRPSDHRPFAKTPRDPSRRS